MAADIYTSESSAFYKATGVTVGSFGDLILFIILGLLFLALLMTLISAFKAWTVEDITFFEFKGLVFRGLIFFCIVVSLLGLG